MIIDRSHKNYCIFTLVATLLLIVSYLVAVSLSREEAYGGSLPGLLYGSLALLIMLFSSLLGARRKVPAWRIGHGTTWLKGHLWFSLLLIPLVLFHSGFRWGGTLTTVIWILFAIVMISGFLGVALQQFIPRFMTEAAPMETIYDQIDHVIAQIRYEADVKVTAVSGPLGFELTPPPKGSPRHGSKRSPLQKGESTLNNFTSSGSVPVSPPTPRLKISFRLRPRHATNSDN